MTTARCLASLSLLVACAEEVVPSSLFIEGSGTRTIGQVEYDTIWSYGGVDDTIFGVPHALAASSDGGLYVLDIAPPAVVRFSATGELEWRWSRIGDGPGEVREVRAFDATPDGGVVLADSSNCQLVFITAGGVVARGHRPVCHSSLFEGIAVLATGDIVLDTSGSPPWVLESATGAEGVLVSSPWKGFETMPFVQRYGRIASWGGDAGWVFGFTTGNGWFVFERSEVNGVFPYVEHTDFPEVTVSQRSDGDVTRTMTRVVRRPLVAAYDIDTQADTLYVLSRGSAPSGRIMDKYSIGSGAYLHSHLLPDGSTSLAVHDSTVFIIDHHQGLYSRITALQTRKET